MDISETIVRVCVLITYSGQTADIKRSQLGMVEKGEC